MNREQPSVAIIVLNWNGWRDTLQCLESLRHSTYPHYEIIVVDNASTDDSVHHIQAAFPWVTLIQNAENGGYAAGNNVGIRYGMKLGAALFWILNNDTIVAPDALTALVEAVDSPKVGIVGSKIFYESAPTHLWFAGGKVDWRRGISYHLGTDELDTGQYDALSESQTANGASMLMTRAAFEQIGLFDESYFLYFEESDLCYRTFKAGFSIRFAPQSHVWHKISRSTGAYSPVTLYYFTRNNIRFVRSHRTTLQFITTLPYLIKRSLQNVMAKQAPRKMRLRRWRVWSLAWRDGMLGRGGQRKGLSTI